MKKYLADCRGMYTVEAAMVMSAILFVLMAMIFAFMLLYQNIVVMYAVDYAAQRGSEDWTKGSQGLYYRLGELMSKQDKNEKTAKIENMAREKLSMGILPSDNVKVDVSYKNTLLQKIVIVRIEQSIPIPLDGIVRYFGGKDTFLISATSRAVVSEPMEFIRNFDLGIEIVTRIYNWANGDKLTKDIGKIVSELGWTNN